MWLLAAYCSDSIGLGFLCGRQESCRRLCGSAFPLRGYCCLYRLIRVPSILPNCRASSAHSSAFGRSRYPASMPIRIWVLSSAVEPFAIVKKREDWGQVLTYNLRGLRRGRPVFRCFGVSVGSGQWAVGSSDDLLARVPRLRSTTSPKSGGWLPDVAVYTPSTSVHGMHRFGMADP